MTEEPFAAAEPPLSAERPTTSVDAAGARDASLVAPPFDEQPQFDFAPRAADTHRVEADEAPFAGRATDVPGADAGAPPAEDAVDTPRAPWRPVESAPFADETATASTPDDVTGEAAARPPTTGGSWLASQAALEQESGESQERKRTRTFAPRGDRQRRRRSVRPM